MNTLLTTLDAKGLRDFYAAGHWRAETIYASVRAQVSRGADRVAVRDRWREITYGSLLDSADRLAADLDSAGLVAGARVAVWLPSRAETLVALLACSRNGYVCCPSLHRDHTVADIRDLLIRMRASALVAERGYGADSDRRNIFQEAAAVPSIRKIYALDALTENCRLFPEIPGTAEARVRDNPDTIVYLAFTSGTTGVPKGVMHSDNTLLANARSLASDWRLDCSTVTYSMSPLSHNLGLGAAIMTLSHGGELVVHDLPRGGSLADRIIEVGASFLIGVPTHAIDLLAEVRTRGLRELGRVRGFRISGASVPPTVAAGLLDHGIVPQSGYGMTEAGSHHYTLPDDDVTRICETSGRACSSYEVKIFAQEDPDRELAPGEIGHIAGRGASLMLGYFDDQEATESSFNRQGWFMTGDLGWMDDQGYLRITGRKKDVIIRGGHNIYPARIEALAMQIDGMERAAAVGVPDERLGEKVCLAVVFRSGSGREPSDILNELSRLGLSRYDMPEYVLRLSQIPLTPSGKILKRDLLDAINTGRLFPEPVRFQRGGGT